MKVSEIFKGIQGEGRYAGEPALFIRLSGCTRNCSFCDTKYHKDGEEMSMEYIIKQIREAKEKVIVWTGGEPLLQANAMIDIIKLTKKKSHHLETNGDLIDSDIRADVLKCTFDYIGISPKDLKTAKKIKDFFKGQLFWVYDIKVVTDLKLNKNLIKYATCLMPLTINNDNKEREIRKKVWIYCTENNIRYTPRLHYEIWGSRRGV